MNRRPSPSDRPDGSCLGRRPEEDDHDEEGGHIPPAPASPAEPPADPAEPMNPA